MRDPTRRAARRRRRRHGRCCCRSRRRSGPPSPAAGVVVARLRRAARSAAASARSLPLSRCAARRLVGRRRRGRRECGSRLEPDDRQRNRASRDQVDSQADGDREREPEQAEQRGAHQLATRQREDDLGAGAAAAVARVPIDADPPTPRERLDDREAEPGSGPVAAAAAEPLEHAAFVTRRHARALVEHRQMAVGPSHRHRRSGGRVHERVLDQVVERDRHVLVGRADECVAVALERQPVSARLGAREPALVRRTRMRSAATPAPATRACRRRARA